jgi:deoxyadenosine/deoxycytidine kinase
MSAHSADPVTHAPFIVVAGTIGAGKSTLVEALADELKVPILDEDFEGNPFLKRFYEDMKTWAFQKDLYFLNQNIRQQYEAIRTGKGGIQDRGASEVHEVFSHKDYDQGLINEEDWQLLSSVWDNAKEMLSPPDLLIYVKVSPEEGLRRIAQRGREMEKGLTLADMQLLDECYERFISEYQESPLITIDNENFHIELASDKHRLCEQLKELGLLSW